MLHSQMTLWRIAVAGRTIDGAAHVVYFDKLLARGMGGIAVTSTARAHVRDRLYWEGTTDNILCKSPHFLHIRP
jgi:hypothetical protein